MPDITSLTTTTSSLNPEEEDSEPTETTPVHPLGVKPSGNALLASTNLRTAIGNFRLIPDDLILTLLEYLDGNSLLSVGRTCKAFYAFTRAEELWKSVFIE